MTTNPYQPNRVSNAGISASDQPAPRERHWILRIKDWKVIAIVVAFIVGFGILMSSVFFLFKA